jgi:hypothetical protein
VNGFKISDLNWILAPSNKLTRYSQLENILARYKKSPVEITADFYKTAVKNSFESLIQILESTDTDNQERKQVRFVAEQFNLMNLKPRRYSVDTMIWSYMIFLQSPSAYAAIRETGFLIVPHWKYLKQLTSSFSCSASSQEENKHFLQSRAKSLSERERFIILQLDEIYVKQRTEYKSGELIGFAENKGNHEQAKTIQAYLASSAFGNFKEVVSLSPVLNMTGEELSEVTQKIIDLLIQCGFVILTIISDNNRMNRTAFNLLVAAAAPKNPLNANLEDKYSVYLIKGAIYEMFLDFDSVHGFKNIRNNWLKANDFEKTLVFPNFDNLDNEKFCEAKFMDLRTFYARKCSNTVLKTGYRFATYLIIPSGYTRTRAND